MSDDLSEAAVESDSLVVEALSDPSALEESDDLLFAPDRLSFL
ncbi:MAG: hypothetical protein VYE75_06535 [Actinomycetota bacterium]|nr:hypothetical protein [Actinomycetota bacterium]